MVTLVTIRPAPCRAKRAFFVHLLEFLPASALWRTPKHLAAGRVTDNMTQNPSCRPVACRDCRIRSFRRTLAEVSPRPDRELPIAHRVIERGHHLFRPGDPLVSLFVVRSGAVKVFMVSPQGRAIIQGVYLPGELCGLAAVSTGTHGCYATALERSSVCEIRYEHLQAAADKAPRAGSELATVFAEEIARVASIVNMLRSRCSVRDRLAALVAELATRLARLDPLPAEFRLPISQADLAEHLCIARESVSRAIAELAESGVALASRRGRLVLRAPQA
jgi:CRP/FNR family transcriptional regulator